ncbi:MAG: copper chaperone PCu(A)C [Gemmatimonadota bacterium]
MNSIRGALVLTLFLSLSCVLVASCGGGGGSDPPEIHVEGGWARAMPLIVEEGQAGTNSAVYLTLRNDGGEPDRLTGGETTAATSVQIHESRMVDDVMRMQRVDGLDIRPGEPVELKPGGVHIMLLGLTRSLVEGEEIDLTLHLLRSDDLVVSVPVRLLEGL